MFKWFWTIDSRWVPLDTEPTNPVKKKNRLFLGGFSAWLHQLFSCQTSAWCNCKKKRFTIFRALVYLQTERWRSYTNTIPKTCYNSSKTAGFPLHLFENSSLEVSEKRRNSSNTSTGAWPDGKVRFILGELFDTWTWQANDLKWLLLDGIESCCVGVEGSGPVKASVSGVSLLQFSPFFTSTFPLFPEKRQILRLLLYRFKIQFYRKIRLICEAYRIDSFYL